MTKNYLHLKGRGLPMIQNETALTAIDLFAGCGGLSLGFQNAGFKILAAFDNWEVSNRFYEKNFEHPIYGLDLEKVVNYSVFKDLNPDIIIGGPPCQDFSHAGKRNENLGRGNLTVSFAKIVTAVKPNWFVMENVDQIKKTEKLKTAIEIFENAGYGLSTSILDASLCGVPQKRKRFFMVGELNGKKGAIESYLTAFLADKPMTVRDYLDYIGYNLGVEHYYRHPRSYKRRGVFSIDEPSPTVRGVNRPIPKTYKQHPGDTANPTDARPLTTIERSYIQTFPQNFIFEGTKSELEQMIGNAVPVRQAEYVANCLKAYIEDKTVGKVVVNSLF